MLLVTPVVASVLALFYVRLSFGVIRLRIQHKISLGNGGNADLERAMRAHGNFAEYVPLALLLLACLELNQAPAPMVWVLGGLLAAGRMVHAQGIKTPASGATPSRKLGMVLTLTTLMGLAACNLGWLLYAGH